MSSYIPDDRAELRLPWKTVKLSERDVSMQIPIDHATHPAVSLSAACFGDKVYEEQATKKCISNLMAAGYRRFHVDLYWSGMRKHWGFCPVAIPIDAVGVTTIPTSVWVSSAPPPTISTGWITGVNPMDPISSDSQTWTSAIEDDDTRINVNSGQPEGPSVTSSPMQPDAALAAEQKVPTSRASSGALLFNIGPYSCTQSLDISTLINVLTQYLEYTEDTLHANMLYVVFNLHAANPSRSPEGPSKAPSVKDLPTPGHLIGELLDQALGTHVYRPSQLKLDRKNLNESWYSVSPDYRPIAEYFTTDTGYQRHRTSDGWPCEGYTVLSRAKRLVLSWGNIDPQMKAYNFSGDADVLYPDDSVASSVDVETSHDGIESGCLYPSNATKAASSNPGWATTNLPAGNLSYLSSFSGQLISCGISPLVNHTLLNVTADKDIEPYRNISLSSTWMWASGEPRNSTGSDGAKPQNSYRCSVLDISLTGRWRARDCFDKLYAACRIDNSPFNWTISNKRTTYAMAQDSCPKNSTFSVPRTALENTYLYNHLISQQRNVINSSSPNEPERVVWVDFNSFDVPTCWVTHGPEAQCPYEVDDTGIEKRAVIVPTVAAIIFLILVALTLFVKCNANRRNSRRRRVIEGWEYEGVPS